MAEPATNLEELHALHQRARAIRDRLASGPRTLATREKVLASRKIDLEKAQKALKDARAHNKNREVQLHSVEAKIDDLKVKLNQAKKQIDYDAIRNQIAHEQASKAKIEDEVLQTYESLEYQASQVAEQEKEIKRLADEVEALRQSISDQKGPDQTLLNELDAAVAGSEEIIPEEQRDQYRRVVKTMTADAMAAMDGYACTGCFVEVTAQMMNDLINGGKLTFCRTCGRVLYIAHQDEPKTKRSKG